MNDNEISREIAEKVMGWHEGDYTNRPAWMNTLPTKEKPASGFAQYVEDWTPATDIAQAFQVVEKMEQDKFYIEIRYEREEGWGWEVEFWKMISDGKVSQLGNQTCETFKELPRTICLAALAAVEQKP
jgi:hypothetical protein